MFVIFFSQFVSDTEKEYDIDLEFESKIDKLLKKMDKEN